jgi:hypothetical protein
MKPKQGDIIKITWLDAFGRGAWNSMEDVDLGLENYITVETVGYYIKEDVNFLVISLGKQSDPHSTPFLHLEFIPNGAIIDIEKLK